METRHAATQRDPQLAVSSAATSGGECEMFFLCDEHWYGRD